MSEAESQPEGNPRKVTLKHLLRSEPVGDVHTSAGRIYLYPLRVRDLTDFRKLAPTDAVSQIRAFLPCIGSFTAESDETPERMPLEAEIASGLSDNEVEELAEAYVQSSALLSTREGSQEQKPLPREPGEPASGYLVRLVKADVEHHDQIAKRLHEKVLGSTRGIFDQVRKSTAMLGSSVSAYEQFAKDSKVPSLEIQPVRMDHFHAVNDQLARQARERAEERAEEMELTRLTGQMTAESAKTLRDLAEAATTLMERLDERDRRNDRSTRTQIKIALWSVASSAVLALIAALFAGFSYVQDRDNNSSEDRWQEKVLTAVESRNQRSAAAEKANQALREQVTVMEGRIADLEKVQRAAAAEAIKAASADRRETKPGSTLPPP